MTTNNLANFIYNGQTIQRRHFDGYINLTQMCIANGKLLADWLRLKTTSAYLEALSSDMGIPISEIIEVVKGGNYKTQGSWGHPSLAINLSRWISPKFAVWCDAHIFNLMQTGQTSLDIDPIHELKLKVELAKYEAQKETAIAQSQSLRYTITQTCPESVQQKVLGYTEIKTIEYRDRIIKENELINDGSTVNKSWLCRRFGFIKKGQPDYKQLNAYLADMPSEAFQLSAKIQEYSEFKREYLPLLERIIDVERQRFLGE